MKLELQGGIIYRSMYSRMGLLASCHPITRTTGTRRLQHMNMKIRFILLGMLATGCASVIQGPTKAPSPDPELNSLVTKLQGNYTTPESAGPRDQYDLHIVPIWNDLEQSRWIYVEINRQGESRPMVQHVYQLRHDARGTIEAIQFDLPGSGREFIGAWRSRQPLNSLVPELLIPRFPCSLQVRLVDGEFIGQMHGTGCMLDNSDRNYYQRGFVAGGSTINWTENIVRPGTRGNQYLTIDFVKAG